MHQQNLGELIPVLVHLGVHSDAHFTLLRKTMAVSSSSVSSACTPTAGTSFTLSPFDGTTDRDTVLKSPKLSRLGDFQKFLLGIAFDIDDGAHHFV